MPDHVACEHSGPRQSDSQNDPVHCRQERSRRTIRTGRWTSHVNDTADFRGPGSLVVLDAEIDRMVASWKTTRLEASLRGESPA